MSLKAAVILTTVGVVVGAGLVTAAMASRSWFGLALVMGMAWLFFAPLSAVGLVTCLVFVRRLPKAVVVFAGCCLLAAAAIPASILGEWLGNMPFRRAQAVAEQTAAALDQYRAQHGRYPPTLDQVCQAGIDVPVPEFQSREGFYHAAEDGTSFTLWLDDPRAPLWREMVFDSETRQWNPVD